MSCDNVIAFNFIGADAKIKAITKSKHNDLFWALRGGGSNHFGVVTSITFALHPLPNSVEGGIVEWPLSELKTILQQYSDKITYGSREQFIYAYIARSTFNEAKISIMSYSENDQYPVDDIARWANFSKVSSRKYTYLECQSNHYESGLALYWKNGIIEGELTDAFIDTLFECYKNCPNNAGGIMLDPLGGAISHVPIKETAFIHRNASFICSITGVSEDDHITNEIIEWVDATYAALSQFFNGKAYQNYEMPNNFPLTGYFGEHLEQLIGLKLKYDPRLKFAGSLQQHLVS